MSSRLQTALRLVAAFGAAFGTAAAPAMAAELLLVQAARGQIASPQAAPSLAAAPYASPTDGRRPGVAIFDRYGAGEHEPEFAQPVAPGGGPARTLLSWSGKSPPPAAAGEVVGRSARVLQADAPSAPAPRAWSVAPPIGAGGMSASSPTAPTSIYDPPPPLRPSIALAAVAQTAQGADAIAGPRRYSVNRDYGVEPDPIPLPPQFFGATADLSQPATPDPAHRTTLPNGKTVNPLQPSEGQ